MRNNSVVIDLGFGDSGKGLLTNYLVQQNTVNSLVVRFNGGHQAGHTVCTEDGKKHVFSNFGSGTLSGALTYWSRYCTVDPVAVIKEYKALKAIYPGMRYDALRMDPLCPVVTPYDIIYNQFLEQKQNKNGSCGVGFGATIERNLGPYKLHVQDLWYPSIVEIKLKSIRNYYRDKFYSIGENAVLILGDKVQFQIDNFMNSLSTLKEIVHCQGEDILKFHDLIFEGAQGVMLDMDHGFFPHVTRSNTTSKNVMEIINRNDLTLPTIHYVTRCYQTRHGVGPMTNEELQLDLVNTEHETNILNTWQGNFRKTVLDMDLLKYALQCDGNYSLHCEKKLMISCLDQLPNNNIPVTWEGELKNYEDPESLAADILSGWAAFLFSYSPYSEKVQKNKTIGKIRKVGA